MNEIINQIQSLVMRVEHATGIEILIWGFLVIGIVFIGTIIFIDTMEDNRRKKHLILREKSECDDAGIHPNFVQWLVSRAPDYQGLLILFGIFLTYLLDRIGLMAIRHESIYILAYRLKYEGFLFIFLIIIYFPISYFFYGGKQKFDEMTIPRGSGRSLPMVQPINCYKALNSDIGFLRKVAGYLQGIIITLISIILGSLFYLIYFIYTTKFALEHLK